MRSKNPGIAWRTLERVKSAMGVEADRVKVADKTEWWWRDPRVKTRGCDWELPPLADLYGN